MPPSSVWGFWAQSAPLPSVFLCLCNRSTVRNGRHLLGSLCRIRPKGPRGVPLRQDLYLRVTDPSSKFALVPPFYRSIHGVSELWGCIRGRDQLTKDDIKVFAAVVANPGRSFPNVSKWYECVSSHLAARFVVLVYRFTIRFLKHNRDWCGLGCRFPICYELGVLEICTVELDVSIVIFHVGDSVPVRI